MKGSRVQMVVQELKGERIDIIPYSQDRRKFVQNSLKPAEVESVELIEGSNQATLVVKDDQLSLAIGKGGLNAKLASMLTGVEIDIVSTTELDASERETRDMLRALPNVDDATVENLMSAGILSFEDILDYGVHEMVETAHLDHDLAERIHDAAEKFLTGEEVPNYLKEDESLEEEYDSEDEDLENGERSVEVDESGEEEEIISDEIAVEDESVSESSGVEAEEAITETEA
jgi:N utilization substance protein A